MHRSSTRRDGARNAGRGGLPPCAVPDGEPTPSTETGQQWIGKSSRKLRPLSSSTNRNLPGPTAADATSLSSAPSEWKLGKLRTVGPTDENDDWILNQQAPPLPLLTDKHRSRTRTSSASNSKNKSDETKRRSFRSQDDTALGARSGRDNQVPLRQRRNTDAQTRGVYPEPDSAMPGKATSLKRRITWARNKKRVQEPPSQESAYERASQLGLPELEKELVPSLRDTVYKMTGEQQVASDSAKHSTRADIPSSSHGRSTQNFSSMLSPPGEYERSRPSLPSRSTSPLPTEVVPEESKCLTNAPPARSYYNENAMVDPASTRQIHEAITADDNDHEVLSKPGRLKTPRAGRSFQSLSPNVDADDSASEPALRTPRMRTSSRSRVGFLLSASTSPAKTPSSIPTPKTRSRSPSFAMHPNKSPSIPQASVHQLPGFLNGRRSPAPVPVQTGDRSRRPSEARCPPANIPQMQSDEDADRTPRANHISRNWEHQTSTGSDSTADEKLRSICRLRYTQPRTYSTSAKRSPNPAHSITQEHCTSAKRERPTMLSVESSASDFSELDTAKMKKKACDDSHLRRKNELADLVAGLNLDLGPQNQARSPAAGHRNAAYDVSSGQSDYSSQEDAIGIAMGGSSEIAEFKKTMKPTNGTNFPGRKGQDSMLRERQDGVPSQRTKYQKRVSSTSERDADSSATNAGQSNNLLKPDSRNINRDSLLMLNSDLQRQAFGIPPSVSDIPEEGEMLSSAESNGSLKNQTTLDPEWEGEDNDGLGLSHGAEQLFHALGIGADAQRGNTQTSKKQRASWRSSMAEAERYLSENRCQAQAIISASSSRTSIYEDDVPDRPWQKRERDLVRIQNSSDSSVKSSWKKTLSRSAYVSLLERYGEAEMLRQEVIWELCETEQAFLKSLRTALKVFVNPLLGKNRQWVSGLPSKISRLLDWLEDIFQLHSQISSALQHARSSQYPVVLRIAETLRTFVPKLEIYQPYIVRLDEVVGDIEDIMDDHKNDLGEFFRIQSSSEECSGTSFSSFLWLPLTRLGKYLRYFDDLWAVTPRSHADHLPTFSLLHSATMVVRVMREVKIREEEYAFIKELLSRVQGSPNLMQIVRRQRRLIAHGALQRVHISERTKDILEGNSPVSRNSRSGVRFEQPHRSYRPTARRRANSLDSCLSEATSMSSMSSAASNTSLTREAHERTNARSAAHERHFGVEQPDNSIHHEKTRTTSLYAFVFTDLAVFASVLLRRSTDGKGDGALELLNDIGICRILSVADYSGNLGYDHLIGIHVLPVDVEQLDSGVLSDGSGTTLFVHLPHARRTASNQSDVRKRWWTAFERCYHFTLRSLSFPTHSGKYLACGPVADQDENTRQSVMAILGSGLPLPKSPSAQIDELQKNAAEDANLREREERGWWALRYQQILNELQRDNLPLSLQRTSTLMPPPSRRKTVSGRRQLKLASGRK